MLKLKGRQILASEELMSARLRTCDICPRKLDWQCGACGCFIQLKASFKNERCPDDPPRW